MIHQKTETFIYEDLGFPVQLIDVPLKKKLGEWILDINLNELQVQVLKLLIKQPLPLQAGELRYIRKFLEMTAVAFGKIFGVTHAAVLKWESGHLPTPSMEVCIRMYVMERLHAKDAEFGKLFHKVTVAGLAEAKKKKVRAQPLTLHIRKRRSSSSLHVD
jgi:DNA-binding transcriptional regulator YiaG